MVLALRREVMYQGAVRDLITCRNGSRRGIGILDVPLAIKLLKSDAQAAKVDVGKQGCVSGNLQTIGNDLGGFAAGFRYFQAGRRRRRASRRLFRRPA